MAYELPLFDRSAVTFNLPYLGQVDIFWYALSYIAGLLIGWYLLKPLAKRSSAVNGKEILSEKAYSDIFIWLILGIILGGRVGYILFYQTEAFLQNPLILLYIRQGGMSFHGGMVGVILSIALFAKVHRTDFVRVTDLLAIVAPIGLFFGRIANFINGELWGRATSSDHPLAVIFANDNLALPRHASQLYEAALEGVLLFIILFVISRTNLLKIRAFLSASFLFFYGLFRFIVEYFREPDAHLGFVALNFSIGQILSLSMIISSLIIFQIFKERA